MEYAPQQTSAFFIMDDESNDQKTSKISRSNVFKKVVAVLAVLIIIALIVIGPPLLKNNSDTINNIQLHNFMPTSFDWRYEPSTMGCNWEPQEEGLCTGGNWALIIAQTLEDTQCVLKQWTGSLSAQQQIDCLKQSDICNIFNDTATFQAALDFVNSTGLYTDACYPYNYLQAEPNNCKTSCVLNTTSNATVSKAFKQIWNASNITDTVNQVMLHVINQSPAMLVMTSYGGLVAYTHGIYNSNPTDVVYGLRALEIVGWNTVNGSKYWIAGNTFSPSWGIQGYIYLNQTDPAIQSYYVPV